jgi:hypothetical protein
MYSRVNNQCSHCSYLFKTGNYGPAGQIWLFATPSGGWVNDYFWPRNKRATERNFWRMPTLPCMIDNKKDSSLVYSERAFSTRLSQSKYQLTVDINLPIYTPLEYTRTVKWESSLIFLSLLRTLLSLAVVYFFSTSIIAASAHCAASSIIIPYTSSLNRVNNCALYCYTIIWTTNFRTLFYLCTKTY